MIPTQSHCAIVLNNIVISCTDSVANWLAFTGHKLPDGTRACLRDLSLEVTFFNLTFFLFILNIIWKIKIHNFDLKIGIARNFPGLIVRITTQFDKLFVDLRIWHYLFIFEIDRLNEIVNSIHFINLKTHVQRQNQIE